MNKISKKIYISKETEDDMFFLFKESGIDSVSQLFSCLIKKARKSGFFDFDKNTLFQHQSKKDKPIRWQDRPLSDLAPEKFCRQRLGGDVREVDGIKTCQVYTDKIPLKISEMLDFYEKKYNKKFQPIGSFDFDEKPIALP
jgi:hypothetical protein